MEVSWLLFLGLLYCSCCIYASSPNSLSICAPGGGSGKPFKFTLSSGKYYYDSSTQKTFSAAQTDCEATGTELATFRAQTDWQAVLSFTNSGNEETWLGLINPNNVNCAGKPACNGKLSWIDDNSALVTASWMPDMQFDESVDCARVSGGIIMDHSCSSNYNYLCQMNGIPNSNCSFPSGAYSQPQMTYCWQWNKTQEDYTVIS